MQHLNQSARIGAFWAILLLFITALAVAPTVQPILAQGGAAEVTNTPTDEPTPPPTDTPVPPTPTPIVPTEEPPTATPPTPGATPTTPPSRPTATPPPGEPVNIPEPITVVLFGTGLAALSAAAAARRKSE